MPVIEKHCPLCGAPMVIRTNGKTGEEFWGCSRYASGACTGTAKLDETTKLLRMGAVTFFDEEPTQ
jgi:ssDNA-binding Zn-finger/Zn-ribbon topoisomerase 1